MRLAVDNRSCTRARLVVSGALDGEAASSSETLVAARHLSACPLCAEFAIGITAFTHALRSARLESSGRKRKHNVNEGGLS